MGNAEHGHGADCKGHRRSDGECEREWWRNDEGEGERCSGSRGQAGGAILQVVSYAADLALTLAVEVPVVLVVAGGVGAGWRRAIEAAALANLLTHPLLWFVVAPALHDRWGMFGVVLAELAVVAVEGLLYVRMLGRWFGAPLAFWLAVLANALSFGVGLVVHHGPS